MIMLDLNVILDVVQRREPHYAASAAVLSRVVRNGVRHLFDGESGFSPKEPLIRPARLPG